MAKRVRVALHGVSNNRGILIDADATDGARIGQNLRWSDGTIVSETEVRNTASTGGSTSTSPVSGGVSIWSLIAGVPAFIKSLADLTGTGFAVRSTVDGDAELREIEGETGRIDVTNGDGVAGNPIIELGDWPTFKNSVETGEEATIPAGHQAIVWEQFTTAGGNLVVDGDLIILDNDNAGVEYFDTIVMDSDPAKGIKIGSEIASDYGWRDITGQIRVRGVPATDPTWSQIGATVFWGWKFALNKYVHIDFHIPHDYVEGTDVYLHCHWLSDGTDTTNTVKWEWDVTHARGFGQEAFNLGSPAVVSAEEASGGQYYHMVTETAAITLSNLQVDGMVYVRMTRVTNGATDNSDGIFVITTDIHYQSHNLATKNKAPDFYT